MPKPVKKKRAAKKPSTDPIVRARQLMQEQMEKVEAGSTFWKPGTSVRHVQSDEQPVPDLDKMPTPKQISALMRELGYEATASKDGEPTIEALNCVYHELAQADQTICSLDLALIENLADAQVEHRACMARGDNACVFCLKAKGAPPRPA